MIIFSGYLHTIKQNHRHTDNRERHIKKYKGCDLMDFTKFDKRFHSVYNYLYDTADRIRTQQIVNTAANTFDTCMKTSAKFKLLASVYCNHRGDLLTSDRECAAYVLATLHYTA